MPYRGIFFEKGKPFHILSRAVEERKIFAEEIDCYRFIFQLQAANLGKPALNLRRLDIIKSAQALLRGEEIPVKFIIKEHPPLVHILDFVLAITHYHLHLLPNIENGVPLFVQKLNCGFAKFFNLKYDRQGSLFGARYKSIPIKTESQLDAVSRYINVINPLDIYQPGWREEGLKDWEEAFRFLENYQFSSFPDRVGKRRAKILAPQQILDRYFFSVDPKKQERYANFVKDFLKQKLVPYQPLFLE